MVCYNCFREKSSYGPCPLCGYNPAGDAEKFPLALKAGSILNGRYTVGRVIGQGGFGITYIAQDYQTKERVAIKEFLPTDFAGRNRESSSVQIYSGERKDNFEYGKAQFLQEAKTLAAFNGDEHIVRIYSYFEENNTAYFVMEYVDGCALDKYMAQKGGRLSVDEANRLLLPLMQSLDKVHARGIVHRDIAPDNIIITKYSNAKLIDFGAARYSTGEKSKSLDVILKHGFAPREQYMRRGRQGPYTDVYALAATYYYAITGKVPPDAIERTEEDVLFPPSSLGVKISAKTEDALFKALEITSSERYQSMGEFHEAMISAAGGRPQSVQKRVYPQPEIPVMRTEQDAEAELERLEQRARELRAEKERLERERREREAREEAVRREQERKEREARELAEKLERERKEREAREEAERKKREAKEAEERRKKELAEQKAREEAERQEKLRLERERREEEKRLAAEKKKQETEEKERLRQEALARQKAEKGRQPRKREKTSLKKKPLTAIVVAVLILVGAIGYFLSTGGKKPAEEATVSQEAAQQGEIKDSTETGMPVSEEKMETGNPFAGLIKVGNTIGFGHYEQDGDLTNGKEPIEWIVLAQEENQILVISRYALDNKAYYDSWRTAPTWENSTIRDWLNSDFLNSAFDQTEQNAVVTSSIDNSDKQGNSRWNSSGGNNTQDKVFFLSYKEADEYFESDIDRICEATAFVSAKSDEESSMGVGVSWWLRSPGAAQEYAACVGRDGMLEDYSYHNVHDSDAVRPVIRIDLLADGIREILNVEKTSSEEGALEQTGATSEEILESRMEAQYQKATAYLNDGHYREALSSFEELKEVGFKDSAERIEDIRSLAEYRAQIWTNPQIGDEVVFGSYEQDNNLDNGTESIEWIVLDVQDGKCLLISKYALDCQQYNNNQNPVTWETCTLRSWLNDSFLSTALSAKEPDVILTGIVDNSASQGNSDWRFGGGNNTKDKVFLLSYAEAEKYFISSKERACNPTNYAAQGQWQKLANRNITWWLRSPGPDYSSAAYVATDGSLGLYNWVNGINRAVRPAMWIEFSGLSEKYLIDEGLQGVQTVGNTVTFGRYEQDNISENGKESIEWIVLDAQDGKSLLMSKYVLDCQPFQTPNTSNLSWGSSSLRQWLNSYFYQEAFQGEEQEYVLKTTLSNYTSKAKNMSFPVVQQQTTEDCVFLLDYETLWQAFPLAKDRQCKPTEFAAHQGVFSEAERGNCWWWMRQVIYNRGNTDIVDANGEYTWGAADVTNNGVRPAIWVSWE